MNKQQALHNFWNSFNLEAYDESTVPDDALFPYITYESPSDSFGNSISARASIWYRSNSWSAITLKEEQISLDISRGGKMVAYDGGAMWIQRSNPWAQRLSDPDDDTIRRIVLNISIEFMD